jgi:hypothetical protein
MGKGAEAGQENAARGPPFCRAELKAELSQNAVPVKCATTAEAPGTRAEGHLYY